MEVRATRLAWEKEEEEDEEEEDKSHSTEPEDRYATIGRQYAPAIG